MTTRSTDDPLPRDPRVDAAWRAASNDEPSPALDAAILAAARREVGAKPQSVAANAAMRARRRWWPLAAAAAVAVIAIGVVQRAGHDELVVPPGDSSIVSDMPAQRPKSVAEAPQRVPEAPRADSGATSQGAVGTQSAARADKSRREITAAPPSEKKAESAASTAPLLPEPFPAASPKPSAGAPRDAAPATPADTGAPQRQEAAASAPAAPAMPPAASFADSTQASGASALRSSAVAKTANAGAAEEGRIKDHAPLPVNDWIALIRRLRDEGRTIEAARELGAFRTAHVDHEKLLPPDLRDWHPADK